MRTTVGLLFGIGLLTGCGAGSDTDESSAWDDLMNYDWPWEWGSEPDLPSETEDDTSEEETTGGDPFWDDEEHWGDDWVDSGRWRWCGDHAPEISDVVFARSESDEPGIHVQFEAQDRDGDLTESVFLIYQEIAEDGTNGPIQVVWLARPTSTESAAMCEAEQLHFDRVIPYSELRLEESSPIPNMWISAQVVISDMTDVHENTIRSDHSAFSPPFLFCMPQENGEPGDCDEEATDTAE